MNDQSQGDLAFDKDLSGERYQYDLFTGERKTVIFSNTRRRPVAKKKFLKPGLAVPGQSMTVEEMLVRHQQGLTIPAVNSEPLYDEEDRPSSGINPRKLDYAELQAMQIANKKQLDELKMRLAAEKREAKTEAEKRAFTEKRKLLAELSAEFYNAEKKRATEEGDGH